MSKLIDLKGLQRFFDNIKKLFASKETENTVKKLKALVPTIVPIATNVGGEGWLYEIPYNIELQDGLGFYFSGENDGTYEIYRPCPVRPKINSTQYEDMLHRAGIDDFTFRCWYANTVYYESIDTDTVAGYGILAEVETDNKRYLVMNEF